MGGVRRSRFGLAVLVGTGTAVLWSLIAVSPAQASVGAAGPSPAPTAAAATPKADLAVVGPEVVSVPLTESGEPVRKRGAAQLLLVNAGDREVRVGVTAVEDATDDPCTVTGVTADPTTVPAHGSAGIAAAFVVDEDCADETGTLLVTAEDGSIAPVAARFALEYRVTMDNDDYKVPILSALGSAVLTLLLLAGLTRWRGRIRDDIDLGPSWSPAGSWLTNVTALTGVLGTVLASSGILDHLLPGVETGSLLGLNLLFASLVLFAPVIYSATARWGWRGGDGDPVFGSRATPVGLVVSTSVSVAGSIGLLATLFVLARAADLTWEVEGLLVVLDLLAAVFVLVYALVWTHQAISGPTVTGTAVGRRTGERSATL